MELTNEQLNIVKKIIPDGAKRKDGRGRPWRVKREIFEGVLWILLTSAPWKYLPDRYPPI